LAVTIVLEYASHLFGFGYELPALVDLLDEGVDVPTDVISSSSWSRCLGARDDTTKASMEQMEGKRSVVRTRDVVSPPVARQR
jgi:hypothetical protein